ncbi:MAG TPA: hypothetical protein VFM39_02355, partial [bacterium]|nr:hypothetical protein [bacterium]
MSAALLRSLVACVAGALLAGLIPVPGEAQQRRDVVVIGAAQEPDILGPFSSMVAAGVVDNA